LAAVAVIEVAARPWLPAAGAQKMAAVGALRFLEALGLILWTARCRPGLAAIGLGRATLVPGLRSGLIWAAGFGVAAAAAGGLLNLGFGIDPVSWIRVMIPGPAAVVFVHLLVAGIVSPITEEVVFRGLLYHLLRPAGAPIAIFGSTLLFAAAHGGPGLPVIPAIGGLVFAWAVEKSRSLAAPAVIHISGNLAIFGLSLI
jgi:membrane protease YdiL (CAAX protease family)